MPRYESHFLPMLNPMSASTSSSLRYHQVVSASVSWPNALPYMSAAKKMSLRPFRSPFTAVELGTPRSWMRPMKRFQRSIAPPAAHDQSAQPSVSAGEAPSWICTGTTPLGQAGPLSQ